MTSTQTIQGKSFKITVHLHEMRFPKNDKNGSHLMISGKPSHIQSQATKPFNPTCDLKRLLSLSAVVKDGSSNIHIFKQTLEIQSFLQDKMQKRNTVKKMQKNKKTITLNTWTFHFGCQMVPEGCQFTILSGFHWHPDSDWKALVQVARVQFCVEFWEASHLSVLCWIRFPGALGRCRGSLDLFLFTKSSLTRFLVQELD